MSYTQQQNSRVSVKASEWKSTGDGKPKGRETSKDERIHSTSQYAVHLFFWIIENVDSILQFMFNDATRERWEIYDEHLLKHHSRERFGIFAISSLLRLISPLSAEMSIPIHSTAALGSYWNLEKYPSRRMYTQISISSELLRCSGLCRVCVL